jgi:hypothetical protein
MDFTQGQVGNPVEPKAVDAYANHAQAVARWHEACRTYKQVSEIKQQAQAVLEEANKILANHLQEAVCDPTIPRPGPPNGGIMGAGQSRGF